MPAIDLSQVPVSELASEMQRRRWQKVRAEAAAEAVAAERKRVQRAAEQRTRRSSR